SSATFTAIFVVFCSHCSRPNSLLVWLNGLAAVSLSVIGITILYFVIFGCREGDNTENDADVVISEIPAEDVEKSPAPVIPYNHIPHYSPFVQPSSRDLPDYFTTMQNSNGGDLPDYYNTSPPCYEKTLEMTRSGTACVDVRSSNNTVRESKITTSLVSRGVIFTRARVSLTPLSLRKKGDNTENDADVVISEIPAEDLEKSPAPVIPYNHIPHYSPFVQPSSRDLPDYFTTMQNSNGGDLPDYYTFCTEYVPTTPPPCYEEALEMTLMAIPVSNEEKDAHFEEL
ncbi:unnamed protein product, partial [Porites evermanni]